MAVIEKQGIQEKETKSFRTLFLILLPSLILTIPFDNWLLNIAVKILLLLMQFVIVKSVLDEYYKYQ